MRAKPFDASQFVATEWNSAADKAAFGNTYLHFIESDWKRSLFTRSFYQRLSNCFGHIAEIRVLVQLEANYRPPFGQADAFAEAPIAFAVEQPTPELLITPIQCTYSKPSRERKFEVLLCLLPRGSDHAPELSR